MDMHATLHVDVTQFEADLDRIIKKIEIASRPWWVPRRIWIWWRA